MCCTVKCWVRLFDFNVLLSSVRIADYTNRHSWKLVIRLFSHRCSFMTLVLGVVQSALDVGC